MLCGANGRIEKAGSRFIRILLSRQYTTTLTEIRDRREEQGKREGHKRSGQWSAVLLETQQSIVQYLQRQVATQGRQRRRTRRDSTEQVDTASTTAKRRATACGRSDDGVRSVTSVAVRKKVRKTRTCDLGSDGTFPEIFTGGNFPENFGNFPYRVRASFFACLFFTVRSMFRDIFTVLSMFL
jgi:hypothetical protein